MASEVMATRSEPGVVIYPRMRGGTPSSFDTTDFDRGLSPHARGNRRSSACQV